MDALEPKSLLTFESVPECSLLIRVQKLSPTRRELDDYVTVLVVREVEFSGTHSSIEDLKATMVVVIRGSRLPDDLYMRLHSSFYPHVLLATDRLFKDVRSLPKNL